jgi:RHS repeat-associated protein
MRILIDVGAHLFFLSEIGSNKIKTFIFEIVTKSMGCLKLAYRSEAEIPIHRDKQEENTVLRCVWNAGEQSKNRVKWYDYGARFYYSQIGRWHCIDNKVEKYCSLSPYIYAANDPIAFVDLYGSDI